ncbi:MAG: hypothetical protein ISS79_00145 [Phycisphaerae bacterium]|nr:hypothetical protein [Phycisphaerae bacterium]
MKTTKNKPKPRIVRVPKQYAGEYVAWPSWHSRKIVAHSKDPSEAYEKARRVGAEQPVLMFIRDPNMVYLY